ncbi:MAG: tryptophan synthase subunit alpha [Chloroflexota bacterium]|nr:tryptophan synthase subunit alpha [Chloroflexota bacterium]
MGRLGAAFARLRSAGEIAFIPGIVPGDPSLELDTDIVRTLAAAGADAIELSYSFSDPVADGPTLQAAHGRALGAGLRKEQAYGWIARARAVTDLPLIVLEYANCVYQFGVDRFYATLADCGADTAIVIDVPPEESSPFRRAAERAGIGSTFFIAPSTSDHRLREIAASAQDWIYVVAVSGITGARSSVEDETTHLLRRARAVTNLPLVIGFGISRPEHVRRVAQAGADGAISCSAVVELIHQHSQQPEEMLSRLAEYVRSMKAAATPAPSS